MRVLALISFSILTLSCSGTTESQAPATSREPADARVRQLADTYLDAYFTQFPENVTYYGVSGKRHDRLQDNSLAALEKWQAQEDRWLADVRGIVSRSGRLRDLDAVSHLAPCGIR